MKKLKILLSLLTVLSLFFITDNLTVKANEKWIKTIDEDGNIVERLNMTDEEIQEMQIEQLKLQEPNKNQRMNENVYSYKFIKQLYDSGKSASSNVIVGTHLKWLQRDSVTFTKGVTFSVTSSYKTITGSASINMSIKNRVSFDKSMDSRLGVFERIKTNRYAVTVKDKYSGRIVSTYNKDMMLTFERSYRPIYAKNNGIVIFKYANKTYNGKIIKRGLKKAPQSAKDLETAKKGYV